MDHPFQVGGIYANRRGSYEVVRLNEATNKLTLRYLETGESVEDDIEFQARVWENMTWDEQEEIREAAEKAARSLKGYGEHFTGLGEEDFKTSTENTTWRGRKGLAGQVAKGLLSKARHPFNSWAIYGWPVAFLSHHDHYQVASSELGIRKAKFIIELDTESAYYGFYIERSNGPMDHDWDWPRLISAFRSSAGLQDVIERAEADHGARFIGRMYKGVEHFHFSDGIRKGAQSLWDEQSPADLSVLDRVGLLDSIPDDYWGEIYIVGAMSKQVAISVGIHADTPMITLMDSLLPIYKAASTAY